MVFSVLKSIFILIEVVLLFNLMIVVHELGHFLAARWRGLVVEKFAVWFGKPIWSKTINGVEYRLGCIPAGGYVALPQMAPMETIEGKVDAEKADLPPVKPLDKIIVAAAGPIFSFGLALIMAVLVFLVGRPESEMDSTTIGYVKPGGPAEIAGLKVGDEILKVDGYPVKHFLSGGTDTVKWRIVRSEGETIPFEIKRGNEILTINSGWVKPKTSGWQRPALREVQLGPRLIPGIGLVRRGTVAEQVGLKGGDLVTSINGTPIFNMDEMLPFFKDNAGGKISLVVDRAGQAVPVTLPLPPAAENPDTLPDLGIDWGRVVFSHPSPWKQVSDAATTIFRMVGALLSPKSDVKAAHFSGPVGIIHLYYQVFETNYGWQLALSLSVLINVNLALINLLPFPVLDGGHIVLALIEGLRRKPVNVRMLEFIQTACAMLLIGFMIYVTFYDVSDFVPHDKPAAESPR